MFFNKFIKRIIIIIFFLIVFISIGLLYERKEREATMKQYPPIGQFYVYNGSKIHYIKEGEGSDTIVLISGSGTASPYGDMYHLQQNLSKHTETIIYERPGYGWSDNTASKRSVTNLTNELEAVLSSATTNNRFIFVGHSMGSLEIFSFAQHYPEKVKGIVLIDGVSPQYASQMKDLVPFSIRIMKFLSNTGTLRLVSQFNQNNFIQNPYLPEDLHDMIVNITLNKIWNSTMIEERKELHHNGEIVNNGNVLGDIPLIIFSAERNPMESWKDSQKELINWSTNSTQIWVDTDNHFIHYEEPNLILKEIRNLLKVE